MRRGLFCVIIMMTLRLPAIWAQEIPKLVKNEYGATQLVVDKKPMLLLCGELHNSSASTVRYMNTMWPLLKSVHLNSVLAPVTWQQIEPKEGHYDFTLVDSLIAGARKNGLRLGLLWFGSWKNGESSYAPSWVKHDTKRFQRVVTKDGTTTPETLSPFCKATMQADARAFSALMKHLGKIDRKLGTVVLVQAENEVGLFQDMDYSEDSRHAYDGQVPSELIKYMQKNEQTLDSHLRECWLNEGKKTKGSWKEVFGDNPWSKSFFTAWQYATYINYVTKAGKAEYALPVYCNCWLVQDERDMPGKYPNGGPVTRVFDIWKVAAPDVDFLAPDIYRDDFKGYTADYHRPDNPLFIPECRLKPENAFYAFAVHAAIGFSPFAIEDVADNQLLAQSYQVLDELMPFITKYQGSNRIAGFVRVKEEKETTFAMGKYRLTFHYDQERAHGMVIQTSDDEFIVAGMGFWADVKAVEGKQAYFEEIWEGGYDERGEWVPYRLLNGDESYHNLRLIAKGRAWRTAERTGLQGEEVSTGGVNPPATYCQTFTPGIYRVKMYQR